MATYSCDKCGDIFEFESLYKRHINRKIQCNLTDDDKLTCKKCKLVLKNRVALHRHNKKCSAGSTQINTTTGAAITAAILAAITAKSTTETPTKSRATTKSRASPGAAARAAARAAEKATTGATPIATTATAGDNAQLVSAVGINNGVNSPTTNNITNNTIRGVSISIDKHSNLNIKIEFK